MRKMSNQSSSSTSENIILGGFSIDIADSTPYILKYKETGLRDMSRVLTSMCDLLSGSVPLHASFLAGDLWAPGDALWGLIRAKSKDRLEKSMSEAVAITTLALAKGMREAENIHREYEESRPRIEMRGVLSFGDVFSSTLVEARGDHPGVRLHNGEALIAAKRLEAYIKSRNVRTRDPAQRQILASSILSIGVNIPHVQKLGASPLTCGLPYLDLEVALEWLDKAGIQISGLAPGLEIFMDSVINAEHQLMVPFSPIVAVEEEPSPLKGLDYRDYLTAVAYVRVRNNRRGLQVNYPDPTPDCKTLSLTENIRDSNDLIGLLDRGLGSIIPQDHPVRSFITDRYKMGEIFLKRNPQNKWILECSSGNHTPRPQALVADFVEKVRVIDLEQNPTFLLGGEREFQVAAHFIGVPGKESLALALIQHEPVFSFASAREALYRNWEIPDPELETLHIQFR